VNAIDPDLICPICHEPFSDPIEVSSCEHVFCKDCLSPLFNSGKDANCPICRCKFTQNQIKDAHRFVKNSLGKIPVQCTNHAHGCSWQGIRSNCSSHLESCGFTLVQCPFSDCGCEEKLTRDQANSHIVESCVISKVPPKLKQFVTTASTTIKDLKKQVETLKKSPSTTDLDAQLMETVWLTIQTAISGYNTVKGGAHIYDQGSPEQCFRLYYLTAASMLHNARSVYGVPLSKKYFWVVILEKVLEDAAPAPMLSYINNSTDDPAWKLRRAFEAIKHGLNLRESKYSTAAFSASRFHNQEYLDIANSPNFRPTKS